jgi:arylsulfatase A-like enzyme
MRAVVVVLNGCPAGWLGGYGNEWVATPNLDRVAAEGVVFDRHVSDCPEPAAARQAWRTGRGQFPPAPLGGDQNSSDLLEILASRGIYTALVRANRPANDVPPGFYAGWAEVFDPRPEGPRLAALLHALPGILARVAAHPEFLLWIEIDRLLPPWEVPPDVFEVYVEELFEGDKPEDDEPPPAWADPPTGWFDPRDTASWELLRRSFAAAVTTFDADLGSVFDLLRGLGDAPWLVTSDYGFPLGEHGVVGPFRPWLHEEAVHVPLIVRLPAAAEAGRRVAALTQPPDLMPTLLGLFGAVGAAGIDGHDLRPLWEGNAEVNRPHAVSAWRAGPAEEWAVRTPDWAFLLPVTPHPEDPPRSAMLFEKPEDRWEVNDLRLRHHDTADALESSLRAAIEPKNCEAQPGEEGSRPAAPHG